MKWISVKDRVPEDSIDGYSSERYLVCENILLNRKRISISPYTGNYTWGDACNVTHWMPLPELPNEEE